MAGPEMQEAGGQQPQRDDGCRLDVSAWEQARLAFTLAGVRGIQGVPSGEHPQENQAE
jgi:hypothetical protein